jgi:hypothetical protein
MNLNEGVLNGVRRIGLRVRDIVIDGGVPGAPLSLRIRGGTRSGAPATGTWKAGTFFPDRAGTMWICTADGTPGTWVSSGVQLDATATDIAPLGTQAAGSSGLAADAKHVHPLPNGVDAADYSYLAWNGDPMMWIAVSAAVTSGTAYVAKVMVRSPISVSKIAVVISNTPNMAANSGAYLALYDHSGTLVGQTADQSTTWNAAALYTPSLTGGPFSLTAQAYYVVFGAGMAASPSITTAPATPVINLNAAGTGIMESMGIASTAPRWGTAGTSLTALPASITPTGLGNTAAKTFLFWCALL